jgi:hypothetical protein
VESDNNSNNNIPAAAQQQQKENIIKIDKTIKTITNNDNNYSSSIFKSDQEEYKYVYSNLDMDKEDT